MKKMLNWFKAHMPTKRKLIQVYAALLFNANLKGFITGDIYKGPVKNTCSPGLGCYSCPGAVGACPLGALQNALSSSGKTAPYYVFGIIMLYGLMFGRWICGFLCPFGLIQELIHKIPTPKLKKSKVTRVLSYFKYVILVFFVVILPLAYAFRNFPLPGFCKYICPVGTLEGAMGLLSNAANEGYLRMLGPLFTWKFLLMISFLVACVFIFRCFCRFFCPLGAIYALFNKIALVGVKVDRQSCTDCGLCIGKCKMDIKKVGDTECIQCGECISACPTKAIEWKGSKIFLLANDIDDTEEDPDIREEKAKKLKKRNTIVKATVASIMAIVLCTALIYFNFIDVKDAPPTGVSVGDTCPDITIDVVGSDEKFDVQLQNDLGKVVVLNFWYTTCAPCLEELPDFYQAAKDYGNAVSIAAIHIDMKNVDASSFIAGSEHPEWNDGTMTICWDTDSALTELFEIQACPVTIVINTDGIITDYFDGKIEANELIAAIDKALGN